MDFSGLFQMEFLMITTVSIGIILKKRNYITDQWKKIMTDMVINIFLPCNIVTSFFIALEDGQLSKILLVLLISFLIHGGCILISLILFRKYDDDKKAVLQYATICSNSSFLGNPVAHGLYGSLGLLYASVYLIPLRIVMWSAGVYCFTKKTEKGAFLKTLRHPCILAVYIGLFIMLMKIEVPEFLLFTLKNIGGCTTTTAMILIGSILAEVNFRSSINKATIYFSFIRLILIPVIVLAFCLLFKLDYIVTGVVVILSGMPAGTTTAMLALKYNGNEKFASMCIIITTAISMFLIPIWFFVIYSLAY